MTHSSDAESQRWSARVTRGCKPNLQITILTVAEFDCLFASLRLRGKLLGPVKYPRGTKRYVYISRRNLYF